MSVKEIAEAMANGNVLFGISQCLKFDSGKKGKGRNASGARSRAEAQALPRRWLRRLDLLCRLGTVPTWVSQGHLLQAFWDFCSLDTAPDVPLAS